MASADEYETESVRPPIRFRFSLLALLIFITVACFVLAWFVQPKRVVVTTLFQVDSSAPLSIDGNESQTLGEREFEILKKTQLALLKSQYVLASAVRNPGIASLSILQGQADPVDWLQNHLDIDFPENAEILSISLHGTEPQQQDLVQLVNAVAKAYKDEVITARRQRKVSDHDLLVRNLANLNQEIARKMEDYLDIARESGRLDHDSGQMRQQLDLKRLDRVEDEIIRLESTLTTSENGDTTKKKSVEERIKQLQEQLASIEKKLVTRAGKTPELEIRRRELEQLQRIRDEMSLRLERLDLESSGPDQIQQLQPAVISPE